MNCKNFNCSIIWKKKAVNYRNLKICCCCHKSKNQIRENKRNYMLSNIICKFCVWMLRFGVTTCRLSATCSSVRRALFKANALWPGGRVRRTRRRLRRNRWRGGGNGSLPTSCRKTTAITRGGCICSRCPGQVLQAL